MTLKCQDHITASAFQIIPELLTPSDLTADLSLQLNVLFLLHLEMALIHKKANLMP